MMNGSEITMIISRDGVTRKQFGGVLAADELPITIKYPPRFYVVNTDERHLPGSHWVAFYFPKKGPAEFFDSLGRAPEHYQQRFKNVLIRNGRSYIFNKIQVQSNNSDTCGKYCIYYLKLRGRGWNMRQIVYMLRKK